MGLVNIFKFSFTVAEGTQPKGAETGGTVEEGLIRAVDENKNEAMDFGT